MIKYAIHKKFNYINGMVTEWVLFTDFMLNTYCAFTTENVYTYITPVVKSKDASMEPYYRIPNLNDKSRTFIGHMQDCYDTVVNEDADTLNVPLMNRNIGDIYPIRYLHRNFGKSKRNSFLKKYDGISFDYIICYKLKDVTSDCPIYFLTEDNKFKRYWTHNTMTFETKEEAEEKLREIYNNKIGYPTMTSKGYLAVYDCINKKYTEQTSILSTGGTKNVHT